MTVLRQVSALVILACLAMPAAAASYEEAVALFEDKHYTEARVEAEKAAKAGDARAMAMLGLIYQDGLGVPADLVKAVDHFAAAAEKGDVGAQYSLAQIYLDGALGETDKERGRFWLLKAAEQGKVEAEHRLGLQAAGDENTPPDWPEAVRWFRKAAERGYPDSQYNLGILYLEGKGVDKDPVRAGEWFSKAAVQGHADAALDYGVMVFRGDGVKKDEKVGADWLLVSARRGNPVAQNRVARLYAVGVVFALDPAEAMKWHILATKGGRTDVWLDEYVAKLTNAQQKEAERRANGFVPVVSGARAGG